jgi:hypothetical protein
MGPKFCNLSLLSRTSAQRHANLHSATATSVYTILSQDVAMPSTTRSQLQQLRSIDPLSDDKNNDHQQTNTRNFAARISSTAAALQSAGYRELQITTKTSKTLSSTINSSSACQQQPSWCTCHASFSILSTTDAELITRCSNREVNRLLHLRNHSTSSVGQLTNRSLCRNSVPPPSMECFTSPA